MLLLLVRKLSVICNSANNLQLSLSLSLSNTHTHTMKAKCRSSSPPSHSSSTPTFIKIIVAFISLLSFSLFFLFKHPSANTPTRNEQLYFFNSTHTNTVASPPAPAQSPAPPRRSGAVVVESTRIINEFGIMTADFMVGELDEGLIQSAVVNAKDTRENGGRDVIKVENFRVCDMSLSDYTPCLDNVEAISEFSSSTTGKGLDCLLPRPKGYKHPILWPESRDEVWFDNVAHTLKDNEGRDWVSKKDDKLIFSRDEPQSVQHLDQVEMVPEIAFGQRTRVVLDIIGSEFANFGAYLMERNVTTLTVAPKDHGTKIQLALERGIPAMVAAFGTRHWPFPSQAFDLIQCSRCGMNWTLDDGVLLLEANRILRAGGYFVWEAESVYNYEGKLGEQWREMEDLTRNLCWELVNKEGYIAVWQKPLNNSCYLDRDPNAQPSLCETDENPDDTWSMKMKKCITRLPENGYGANITSWPARLHTLPERLFSIKTDAIESRRQLYRADTSYWKGIVNGFTNVFKINEVKIRNVMDMKAGYGWFAAALLDSQANSWVMNVVPVSGPNTLPVIYDRGLIGVMHDWCEPFDTYPRTYDLLNAAGLFSVEQKRCNVTNIMLEMDRILRPDGRVYIIDSTSVIYEVREIANAMGWRVLMFDTEEGPYSNWKLLVCTKPW